MINWKVLGLVTSVAAGAISIAAGVIEDKKMEATIEEKVDKALAERDEIAS